MTVVTAPSGAVVAPFTNGYSYSSSSNLSVRADPVSGVVSVTFKLDGKLIRTENDIPYSVAGDNNGSYKAWRPAVGNHTLVATPFSATSGTGTAGTPVTVTFTVINSGPTPTPTPGAPQLSGMTVVTAPGGAVVAPFTNGYSYSSSSNLSVRADPVSGVVSVTFKLDGKLIRTENTIPYSVAGDNNGSYTAWRPAAGNHTLVATPFSGSNATGTSGAPVTVSFTATP